MEKTLACNVLNGGTIISTANQVFPGNSGTFNVCIPPGTPPGSISLQATSVADAACNCN